MASNESMEMYLETVYVLQRSHGHAHGVEVAKRLGVSKPSVSKAMKDLKEQGLVNKESYGAITLTDKGRRISESIYNKHRLISAYLQHSLGLTPKEAGDNACKMEHVLTDDMISAIEVYIDKYQIGDVV